MLLVRFSHGSMSFANFMLVPHRNELARSLRGLLMDGYIAFVHCRSGTDRYRARRSSGRMDVGRVSK